MKAHAERNPELAEAAREWPTPIPGTRLGVDVAAGTAYIKEPLHELNELTNRTKILRKHTLPPPREDLPNVDVPTFLFWLRAAVKAGCARLISGKLPEGKIHGARTRFVTQDPKDPKDVLVARLTATMFAMLTPAQQKVFKEQMDEAADE